MAQQDKLLYFDLRGRGEPIRMIYAIAGKDMTDERFSEEQWPAIKEDQPLGQLPVMVTEEGTLCQSNVIARYAAKKLGLMGRGLWEETLHDLVLECTMEMIKDVPIKIYKWKLRNFPEPENSNEIVQEVKAGLKSKIPYIQSIAEKQGKKFIVGDSIGLAEVWLYANLEFCKAAFPDVMELTPWLKDFTEKFESDEKIKQYLATRPDSLI